MNEQLELSFLKQDVEQAFGRRLATTADFEALAEEMNDSCSECIHHVRHSHLSSADFCIDQCVLCQFLTLPFIVAGLMILGITLVVRYKRWQGTHFHYPASAAGYISLRAPPCICLN